MDNVIGIDLGTSAVKVLQRFSDGRVRKVREKYGGELPEGWFAAVCRALGRLDLRGTRGIGLDAQVGTYVVDGRTVIGWNARAGSEEIGEVLTFCTGDAWEREIRMRHPHIVSYPLPRLLYIRRHLPGAREICQPKDWLYRRLTGEYFSDPWSWRGLADTSAGRYSRALLERTGFSEENLPPLAAPAASPGRTRARGGIPAGIPVFVGLNDFYASLLGMGMAPGLLFDITGTSEHLGLIEEEYRPDERLVSGPWLRGYAHYGGTASGGASLAFSGQLDPAPFRCAGPEEADAVLGRMRGRKPPVFLPYLTGERAPIWDADARGVFFGISAGCTRHDLAYAAMEGVCFSLYGIYGALGAPKADAMRVAGGAAVNPLLNRLKASLFGLPLERPEEQDTTAMGAALTALTGLGRYASLEEAASAGGRAVPAAEPDPGLRGWLLDRYRIYGRLYPALADSMKEWRTLES